MKRRLFPLCLSLLLTMTVPAWADSVLQIGGTYTSPIYLLENGTTPLSEGGGSIDTSYLNSVKLNFLYCVDIFTTVNVPATYLNTTVNNSGEIYGSPLNNAGQVAWLLSNYGTAGQGDQAYALQAAIWHVIYEGTGKTIDINPALSTATEVSLYNTYLAELGNKTGNVGNLLWITPGTKDSNGNVVSYQGLVGATPVPIPAAIWIFGSGLLGLIGIKRR
jgi:hypothetical protein